MVDQPGDDAVLIGDLVQLPDATADRRRRYLPNQRQHRRAHAIGGEQGRAGIEQAWARHHRIDLRAAGRQRRAQRHIGGALLVAGVHDAQGIARTLHGVE
jgi:hypothetical protein